MTQMICDKAHEEHHCIGCYHKKSHAPHSTCEKLCLPGGHCIPVPQTTTTPATARFAAEIKEIRSALGVFLQTKKKTEFEAKVAGILEDIWDAAVEDTKLTIGDWHKP